MNIFEMSKFFVQLVWSFVIILMSCEFGQKLTNAFDQIDYEFCRFNWYKLPFDMWQMLPILIAASQKSIGLCVFGSISCEREDFKKVNNTLNR